MRTVHADLDARMLETKRCRGWRATACARWSGPRRRADIDVDDDPFEPPEVTDRPVTYYEDLARANGPR